MIKKCFLFEGQGAQFQGMGKDIYDSFAAAQKVFEVGSNVTGVDLQRLCFETEADELNQTKNSQLAIFTVSMSIYNVLKESGFVPDFFAGFSLGECSALCAAGVISLENGFEIVRNRGTLMQECAEAKRGAMYAVIGLEDNVVEDICKSTEGYVIAANYNCPSQLVIAGDEKSADSAAQACLAKGAAKAVRLAVNGAFHTKHMDDASKAFKEFLQRFEFSTPNGRLFSNASGSEVVDFSDIPSYLSNHIISPVRWKEEIAGISNLNELTFFEIGCGKTLTGLNRKIDRGLQTVNLSAVKSLSEVI